MIRLEHVRKEFEKSIPIADVTTTFANGTIVSLIGPSGTGKSTLIRMINGLETPTSGKIFFNDQEITAKGVDFCQVRKRIGMIFQHYNLFQHLSVLDNLVIPQMDILKVSRAEAVEKAEKLLAKVGLLRQKNQMPSALSGGQSQRVAIVRALCMDPEVLLFDEPTSALDPTMSQEIQKLIKDLANEKRTIIIVTHDMNFAEQVSDEVIFLSDGGIVERGTPEQIFHHPEEHLTKIFVEQLQYLEIASYSDDFTFENGKQAIDSYATQQNVDFRSYNHMMSVMEELVLNILCSSEENLSFRLNILYRKDENCPFYKLRYDGPAKNLLEDDADLSTRIIKNRINILDYVYNEGRTMPNELSFRAK